MHQQKLKNPAAVAAIIYLMIVMLLVVLTTSLRSQTINVANPSTQRQVRWCVCPMPLSQADRLPAACVVAGRYPAYKAEQLGVVTQLWHVRCDVPALGMLSLTDWKPLVGPVPVFELSPWITDKPMRALARYSIYEGGAWKRDLSNPAGTKVAESPVSQTWEFRASAGGYHAVWWARFWLGQDAIDLEGSVIWSDPTSPDWTRPDVKIDLVGGMWPTIGEPIALYGAAANGFGKWANGYTLYRGKLPHGVGIAFRGVILPQDDGLLPITLDAQRAGVLDGDRARFEAAAAEAPLVAACDWTQSPGDWMAFGKVPVTAVRADKVAVLATLSRAGTYFAPRPYANGANHGGTGDQPPFGSLKDLIALQGDPWRVLELQDSALDYWRRGFHHRELDGRRVTRQIRPGLQTWQGTIEPKMSPDTFGKPQADAPYEWDQVGGRSILADDQHRGDGYIFCCYALSGSQLLLECIRDVLVVDEMRAMPARGWFDGPRACGRLWQSWARVATITSGAYRELALRLGEAERADRQRDQDAWAYNPVRVVEWKPADPRVLSGAPFSVPWNDSLFVLGLAEQAAARRRLGLDAAPFTALAERIGTSVVRWATVTDSRTGETLPINGLKWLDGGAANPPAYYVYPRPGAATDAAVDMLVGSMGWWTWYAGSLSISMDSANADIKNKATAIWTAATAGQQSVSALEWWALR